MESLSNLVRVGESFSLPDWRLFSFLKTAGLMLLGVVLYSLATWDNRITRFTYTLGLIFISVVAWGLRNWGAELVPLGADLCIGECFQFAIVYQLTLGFCIYHLILAFLLLGVKNRRPQRANFHHSWWLFKAIALALICFGCLYIKEEFFTAYAMVVTIGGIAFFLVQGVAIIKISKTLAVNCSQSNGLYHTLWITSSTVNLVIAQGASIVFYYYFNETISLTPAITNNVLVALGVIISILPGVQGRVHGAGIGNASIIALYATYLTASAIGSDPSLQTNRLVWEILFWIGLVGAVISILFASLMNWSQGENDEDDYNYTLFHLLLVLAGFFIAACLTNWALFGGDGNFDGEDFAVGQSQAAFWIKTVVMMATHVGFIGSMVLPTISPGIFSGKSPDRIDFDMM